MSISISDKINFRAKNTIGNKEVLYNDGSVNSPRTHSNPKGVCTKQQSCKILIKLQKLIKLEGEIGKSIINVGDVNMPLLIIDRTKQKTSKSIEKFDNTINQ